MYHIKKNSFHCFRYKFLFIFLLLLQSCNTTGSLKEISNNITLPSMSANSFTKSFSLPKLSIPLFKNKCTTLCNPKFVKDASLADYKIYLDTDHTFDSVNKSNGWTPIMYLLKYSNNDELIFFAFENSKNLDVKSNSGTHPLHIAAQHQSLEIFNELITLVKNKNPKTQKGMPLNHFAAQNKSYDIIVKLIEDGEDINQNHNGWTPLSYAALNGSSILIDKLISLGANTDKAQVNDWNILLIAVQGSTSRNYEEEIEVIKTLNKHGLNIKSKTKNGRNAIHIASSFNKEDPKPVIKFLWDNGVNIDELSNDNKTALHYAAQNRNILSTKALLEFGVDPNVRDKYLNTAIMTAVYQSKVNVDTIVEMLLNNGAIAGAVNKDNFSTYGLARINKVVSSSQLNRLLQGAKKTRKIQVFSGNFYCENKIWNNSSYRYISIGDDGGHYAVMYELKRQQYPQIPQKYLCRNAKWERSGNKLRSISIDKNNWGGVYAIKDRNIDFYVYIQNVLNEEM